MLAKTIMILLVITVSAQSATAQSTFGDIVGVVKDQHQGVVPNAQIVLTSVDDGSQHPTTSDADGAFHYEEEILRGAVEIRHLCDHNSKRQGMSYTTNDSEKSIRKS
jgi:hypothetical protein